MGDPDPFRTSASQRREVLEFIHRILSLAQSASTQVVVDQQHVLRRLFPREIEMLQTSCTCKDWTQISLLLSPPDQATIDQSHRLQELVTHNHLEGPVVLSLSNHNPTIAEHPFSKLPLGIHNNLLIGPNAIISTQSWVCRNTVVSDTAVFPSSVLVGCGTITAGSTKNNGQLSLTVGPESGGGRALVVHPESDMIQVCEQLTGRKKATLLMNAAPGVNTKMNVISNHCIVRDTPSLQGIHLHSGASIQAATSVSNAILLPQASIQNACTVDNVQLQWNASIVDSSRVSDTLLMEQAQIGPNSLVASSILGPDVHVSAGEVHASILGPNTNAHHQSLVISVLWPLGRGNVGYGANIGSNHTGRIPDQETTSGEGVFWGLSCVIKFPVDLTSAPYSIVAAGTTLPPQRVGMPFSLIVASSGDHNSILPGWVLASSPYTVARSEKKYATRRKATRHKHYTGWKIIRPETIRMCQWARKQLVDAQESKEYVTEKAIKGIGSNVLTEKGRRSGIKAYTDCIQRFALEGLLTWCLRQSVVDASALQQEFGDVRTNIFGQEVTYEQVAWPVLPWETTSSKQQLWEFQKAILLEEFPLQGGTDVWASKVLQTLVQLENAYADKIFKCKKRDDQRGAQIVPGYAESHKAAETDSVIKEARKKSEEVEAQVKQCVGRISSPQRSKL